MKSVSEQSLSKIKMIMANMNFIWIVFFPFFIYTTTRHIVATNSSLRFIDSLEKIPSDPRFSFFSIFYFTVLLLIMHVRKKGKGSGTSTVLFMISEFLVSILLMETIDFTNNGILLLVAVDILDLNSRNSIKIVALVCLLVLYVLTISNIVTVSNYSTPFVKYLDYYNATVCFILLCGKGFLVTGITVLFIVYIAVFIQLQEQENKRVKSLNRQLEAANRKLQMYSKTVEKMSQTRERNRLAREIHDTLGHTLTNILSSLDACITLIGISIQDTKEQLRITRDVAARGIVDVRRSVRALEPDALENATLNEALDRTRRQAEAACGIKITINNQLGNTSFDMDEKETIYRIIQESITNAMSHGKAKSIRIELHRKRHTVQVKIIDNGIGCKKIYPGFGLCHMAERIEMLGGSLEYDGSNGFTIIAHIPIRGIAI